MEEQLQTNISSMVIDDNEESRDGFHYLYILVPVVSIEIILSAGSNAILLLLITQFWKTCTSLNIYLLSICGFNLIELLNQVMMMVVIFRRGLYIPTQFCRLQIITRTMSSIGIFATHLMLSYDRYIIAKHPLLWTTNRKRAWIYMIVIWVGSFGLGVLECLLHFENFTGYYGACLWPMTVSCNLTYKLSLKVVGVGLFTSGTVVIYYLYAKTINELNVNEIDKEIKLKSTSEVKRSKRKRTVPERAVLSLVVVFTVHILSQLPLHIYNTIRYLISLSTNKGEELPHMIMFLLICISFITTSSPFILMLINERLKAQVQKLFCCLIKHHNDDPEFLIKTLSAEVPELEEKQKPKPQPKRYHNDPLIFFGGRARQYQTKLTVPEPKKSHRNSPSRRSIASAAINAGLVLSAAGHHHTLINKCFSGNIEEELASVANDLDTLYLF